MTAGHYIQHESSVDLVTLTTTANHDENLYKRYTNYWQVNQKYIYFLFLNYKKS